MAKTPKYQKFVELFKHKVDPWGFSESIYERGRLAKILEIARSVPHKSVLEIGCAEGHFTQKLLTISDSVTAIDVSKEAILRAKKRAPGAKYIVTSIDDLDLKSPKFDLAVASEVLYYIRDKKPIFKKISKSCRYLLMTNVGIWDYLLAIHLRGATLIKRTHYSRFSEGLRYFCAVSLWKLQA